MSRNLPSSSLVPAGLSVEGISADDTTVVVTARRSSAVAACPRCQGISRRVHSRYVRRVSDLPCAGRGVHLRLIARRFRCEQPLCRQRIFAERFEEGIVPTRSRRTARLDGIVHCLGLALGGRPGASFAKRLMLPVSNDTLLRTVRRRRPPEPLKIVGVDDWAFRRITATAVSSATSNGDGSWRCRVRVSRVLRGLILLRVIRRSGAGRGSPASP